MAQEQLTCQTCKYWHLGQNQVRLPKRRLCLLTTSAADSELDSDITIGHVQSTAVATANVILPFGGGMVAAGLETGPRHYCNQHEAK